MSLKHRRDVGIWLGEWIGFARVRSMLEVRQEDLFNLPIVFSVILPCRYIRLWLVLSSGQ